MLRHSNANIRSNERREIDGALLRVLRDGKARCALDPIIMA